MILFIDNYDSFTYNLVQYIGEQESDLKVFRNDKVTIDKIEKLSPKGIVISPGPGTPENAGISVDVIKKLYNKIPILGVCLGHQAIAYAFGGDVVGASEIVHGKTSQIYHDSKTIFKGLDNPFIATRYHSLVVKTETLPKCFEISCKTENNIIMGIRHKEHPVEGVQFHPESILTTSGKKIIANFISSL
ncbi:MAG: aminodeoxychorismate/anthranilate synthase component II [Spirochaetota bacterium]|nr:aminodeoxychorismate/anthranilate synthase component II [Spirochaetota bacterium]